MEATSDQRRDFGRALTVVMSVAAATKRDVAEALGITENSVWNYMTGRREPDRSTVFALEDHLGRQPGELSRLLGYLPVGARNPRTVLDALAADVHLDARAKDILRAAYMAALD